MHISSVTVCHVPQFYTPLCWFCWLDEERPDKLIKIRWYLDYLDQKCSYNFIPKTNATFDESMIKFKGRLLFRQYLPAKPTKWGVKLFVLEM
jgi:hypothetical protein